MKPTPAQLNYDDDHASIGQTTRSNGAFWIALAPASYSGAGIVYLFRHHRRDHRARRRRRHRDASDGGTPGGPVEQVAGRAQFRQCEFIDVLLALLVNAD
jgi:hypothetical protein